MKYSPWMTAVALSMLLSACPDAGSNIKPNTVGAGGGALSFNDGAVKFEFPAGAVAQDTTLSVQTLSATPTDPAPIADTTFSFSPDGISFTKPVKLTLRYDPSKLPAGVAETELTISKVVSNAWQTKTSTVDTAAKTVSADLTGFSDYGVTPPPQNLVKKRLDWNGRANRIAVGQAGYIYISGTSSEDLDGTNPDKKYRGFVAKLNDSLQVQWVKMFDQPLGGMAVGPTANLYCTEFGTTIGTGSKLWGLNSSGQVRTGFPVKIAQDYIKDVAVDIQDNIYVLGFVDFNPSVSLNDRSFLASYSESGKVRLAPTILNFGLAANVFNFPIAIRFGRSPDFSVFNPELYVLVVSMPPTGPIGFVLNRLNPQFQSTTGFPVAITSNSKGNQLGPFALAVSSVPGNAFVFSNDYDPVAPTEIHAFNASANAVAGFPLAVSLGNDILVDNVANYIFQSQSVTVDGQGNLFMLATTNIISNPNDKPEFVVLSLNSSGKLRSGFPVKLGTWTQSGYSDEFNAIGVDGVGRLFVAGNMPNQTNTLRQDVVVIRLPAN